MVSIAICGADGKMGRVVAGMVSERKDCRVIGGVDRLCEQYAGFPVVEKAGELPCVPDVIIDFSHPSALSELLEYALTNGSALVIASTGYSDAQITEIKKAAEQIPVFFTFNLSLGINLMAELARRAAAVLGGGFDIEIVEKHHNQKLDAPSGTAIMLCNALNDSLDGNYSPVYDRHSCRARRSKNEIGIHSIRGGTIVGEHEIIFAGQDEVFTLKHEAHSKQVFANGAVAAAVFLADQPAGLYTMNELLADGRG